MRSPNQAKITIDQFFEAIAGLEGRFELVDGIAYAMAGAKQGHNVICSNMQAALVPAGKKAGCRTTSADTAVRTGADTIRYPDVVVDCGPSDPLALTASRPTIIVEVSSPGTAVFDYGAKLQEYQRLESVEAILQVESEVALVKVHRRSTAGWIEETFEAFDQRIDLLVLGMSLTLAEIYDTLDVRPRLRLSVVPAPR